MRTSFTVRLALLMAGYALCGSGIASASTPDTQAAKAAGAKAMATLTRLVGMDRHSAGRAADESARMLPGKILEYDWENEAWSQPKTILRTYTPDGLVKEESEINPETGVKTVTAYTYNQDGLPVLEVVTDVHVDQEVPVPVKRTTYEYDAVVKNFCVSKITEQYYNGAWTPDESEVYQVTRNADGNVTEIVYSENGHPDTSMRMEYGTDGKAVKISEYDYYDGEWELISVMSEIVWYETNGQLLEAVEDFGNFMTGANRIKKATQDILYEEETGGPTKMTIEVEYAENGAANASINGTMDGLNINGSTMTYTPLEYGGSDLSIVLNVRYGFMPIQTRIVNRLEFDAWHNKLLEKSGMSLMGDTEYDIYEKGEVTYSAQTGLPETYILKESEGTADSYSLEEEPTDLVNKEKLEFSDYITSGIGAIAAETDGTVEFFDLNGLRVDRPANGIYIMRRNGRTTKILL